MEGELALVIKDGEFRPQSERVPSRATNKTFWTTEFLDGISSILQGQAVELLEDFLCCLQVSLRVGQCPKECYGLGGLLITEATGILR